MSDVSCDFLLGFGFRFAGEHLAALDALLIKVPDDTLPAAIGAAKDVAVSSEPFLWQSW